MASPNTAPTAGKMLLFLRGTPEQPPEGVVGEADLESDTLEKTVQFSQSGWWGESGCV